MKHLFRSGHRSQLSLIYAEAGLSEEIRRSLNLILLGNVFGNLFGIICGGGTTAMNGLASELHAKSKVSERPISFPIIVNGRNINNIYKYFI